MEVFGNLGINVQTLIFQIINFLLLLWILKKLLYTPILTVLEARRQKVEEGAALIARAQEESESAQAAAAKELEEARTRAGEIVARAQKQASETTKNASEEAQVKTEEMIASAKAAIAAEKEGLLADVRDEIAGLVVATSTQVLERELDGKQEAYAKEVIDQKV